MIEVKCQQRTCEATNLNCFHTAFAASLASYATIITDLQTTEVEAAQIKKLASCAFLIAINWLSTYKTEIEMAGIFKIGEKTACKYAWKCASAIQALKETKVINFVQILSFHLLLLLTFCRLFGNGMIPMMVTYLLFLSTECIVMLVNFSSHIMSMK